VTGLHSQSRGACACPPCTVRSRCDSLQTPGRSVVALLLRAVRSPDRFLVCFHQLRQGLCLGHHFASPPGGALGRLLHKAVHAARTDVGWDYSRPSHGAQGARSMAQGPTHHQRLALGNVSPNWKRLGIARGRMNSYQPLISRFGGATTDIMLVSAVRCDTWCSRCLHTAVQ
jgi:hypothetical protein